MLSGRRLALVNRKGSLNLCVCIVLPVLMMLTIRHLAGSNVCVASGARTAPICVG